MGDSDAGLVVHQVLSAISAAGSLSVVVSCLCLYPSLLRHSQYHNVFVLNVCQLFIGIAGAIGFPRVSSSACIIKGVLWLLFFPASWFWNCFAIVSLWEHISKTKIREGGRVDDIEKVEEMHQERIKRQEEGGESGENENDVEMDGKAEMQMKYAGQSRSWVLSIYTIRHTIVIVVTLGFLVILEGMNMRPHEVVCRGNDKIAQEVVYTYIFAILSISILVIGSYTWKLRRYYSKHSMQMLKQGGTGEDETKNILHVQLYPLSLFFTWSLVYVILMCVYASLESADFKEIEHVYVSAGNVVEEILSFLPTIVGMWHCYLFTFHGKEVRNMAARKYGSHAKVVAIDEASIGEERVRKGSGNNDGGTNQKYLMNEVEREREVGVGVGTHTKNAQLDEEYAREMGMMDEKFREINRIKPAQ